MQAISSETIFRFENLFLDGFVPAVGQSQQTHHPLAARLCRVLNTLGNSRKQGAIVPRNSSKKVRPWKYSWAPFPCNICRLGFLYSPRQLHCHGANLPFQSSQYIAGEFSEWRRCHRRNDTSPTAAYFFPTDKQPKPSHSPSLHCTNFSQNCCAATLAYAKVVLTSRQ